MIYNNQERDAKKTLSNHVHGCKENTGKLYKYTLHKNFIDFKERNLWKMLPWKQYAKVIPIIKNYVSF